MLPIYALVLPLYEPALRGALRGRRAPRCTAAGSSASSTRRKRSCDERAVGCRGTTATRLNVDGFIRLDYFFVWAAAGIALKPLHDLLVRQSELRP